MSLTACIKKAAKAISPDDAQYLSQARSEFMQEGMTAVEADRAAVQSLLDTTTEELRELSYKVEMQGGKPLFTEEQPAAPMQETGKPAMKRRQAPRGATRMPNFNSSLPDSEVAQVVDEIFTGFEDARGQVEIVRTFEDLPDVIKEQARAEGSDDTRVHAVYHRGRVYVVQDQMRTRSDLEEAIFHESTHAGVDAMYSNAEIRQLFSDVWENMGGQEGFDSLVKELGIEKQAQAYTSVAGQMDETSRNQFLVSEMLALVGEKGSKGLRLKIKELIGAIRRWMRENGYFSLSRMRASDVADLAKRSREHFLQGQSGGSGRVQFQYARRRSTDPRDYTRPYTGNPQDEAEYTQGLYSNAEKVLIDEGDKIFKTSKKNPEGKAPGKQIYTFLKARGLKADEEKLTGLEEFLSNSGPLSREEIISYLRENTAIEVEQLSDDPDGGGEADLDWQEQVEDGHEYYEHEVEYILDSQGEKHGPWADVLKEYIRRYSNDIDMDLVNKQTDSFEDFDDLASLEVELGEMALFEAVYEAYMDDVTDLIDEYARDMYMENPYLSVWVDIPETRARVRLWGNDDLGWRGEVYDNNQIVLNIEDVWDLNEAQVQATQALYEYDLVPNARGEGDTRFRDYLQLDDDDYSQYREILISIPDNPDGSYSKNHWSKHNLLANMLVTDREFDGFGETFFIEESQADWHSDIRKTAGMQLAEYAINGSKDHQVLRMIAKFPMYQVAQYHKMTPEEIRATVAKYRNIAKEKGDLPTGLRDVEAQQKALQELDTIREEARAVYTLGVELRGQAEMDVMTELMSPELEAEVIKMYPRLEGKLRPSITTEIVRKATKVFALDSILTEEGKRAIRENGIDGVTGDSAQEEELLDDVARLDRWVETYVKEEHRTSESAIKVISGYKSWRDEFEFLNEAFGFMRPQFAEIAENKVYLENVQELQDKLVEKTENLAGAPPNVPFRDDRYQSLILKKAIIKAVEEGKTAIGFSTGERVANRWNDGIEYGPIYDRKMLKEARKLTGVKETLLEGDKYVFQITPELRTKVVEEGLPMFQRRSVNFSTPEEGIADKFIRTFQDKFLQVQRVQRASGATLDPSEDTYMMEQFFTGKVEEDLKKIERKIIKPMMDLMGAKGISLKELDLFLMARHAPERNATIAERRTPKATKENPNPESDMPDGGSGMTNQQAADWMAAFDAEGKLAALQEIAVYVDQLTAEQRRIMGELDLVSNAQIELMNSNWKHYVPLKGFAEDAESEGRQLYQNRGKGFDIRGKEYRAATGRLSMPESPTAVLISDLTEKIIRARKNEVGKAFLSFVRSNPNPDSYQILTPGQLPKGYNGELDANGKPVERAIDLNADPSILAVKEGGETKYIKIHDELLARAMKNMGPEEMSKVTKMVNIGTRFLAWANTSGSPEFPPINWVRDIQTAVMNVLAEQDLKDGKLKNVDGLASKIAKGAFGRVKTINDYYTKINADPNYKPVGIEADFQEFLDMGAKTGYFDSKDIDQLKKDLDGMLSMAGNTNKGAFLRARKKVVDKIEQWNTSVENGVRLSAYIEARDALYEAAVSSGVDPDKAMSDAKIRAADLSKNLTVNFNRKGEKGQALNAWYMFANASIQGSFNLLRAVSPLRRNADGDFKFDPKMNTAQRVAAGMVATGYFFAAMNRAAGEDEDGVPYWDKVPRHVRERNLVLLFPNDPTKYYTFPLPYGFNIFFNMGDVAEGAINSDYLPRRRGLLGQMILGSLNSFSPFGVPAGDDALTGVGLTLTPSVLKPFAELMTNQSEFTGGPIYPEEMPYGAQPVESYRSFRSTKEVYKDITEFMNDFSGGNKYESGYVDIAPDSLEHVVEYALGGMYRTGSRLLETIDALGDGRELAPNNVPYLRSFVGENKFYEDQSIFYDRLEDIDNVRAGSRDRESTPEERGAIRKQSMWKIKLHAHAKAARKKLKFYRDARDRIVASDKYTDAEKDLKVRELETKMKGVVDAFNAKYNEAEKRSLGDG